MKNTTIIIMAVLCTLFHSCSKSISLPVKSCGTDVSSISEEHPMGVEIQSLLDKYVKMGFPGVAALVYTPEHGE